jgi:transketolase
MNESIPTRVAFGKALAEAGFENKQIVVLDADLANATRVDFFARAHPERFLQMGIAEQNMVGVAAGLSTLGLIPFVSSFACFAAERDLDQIRVVVAQPRLNVKIYGAYSGLLNGRTGKSHQTVEDLTIFRAMPNMVVLAPADAVETRRVVSWMVKYRGPVYFRLTRDASPVIFGDDYSFVMGKAVVLREGNDVSLLSTGIQTYRVLEAADRLAAEGVSAHLLHLGTVKPLDRPAVIEAAVRTGCVVTCEDHSIIGGLGGAVAEMLAEEYPTPMRRVGIQDVYNESAPDNELLEKYGLTSGHVVAAAREVMETKRRFKS